MKRLLSLFLAFTIMLTLCACQGNFGSVNLKDSVSIPDDGIIDESILQQLKAENAIGIFTGVSNEFQYEWKIFGSSISDVKQINLQVLLTETEDGAMTVVLSQAESFGFSAVLSITLDKQWNAQSAIAYADETEFAEVSITGSNVMILNISLDGTMNEFVICPVLTQEDTLPTTATTVPTAENEKEATTPATEETQPEPTKDKYLTDPVPEGKPNPVEPEDQDVNKGQAYTCTFSIECSTILNNLDMLDPEKLEMVPTGGVILPKATVTFYEGESVYDVLQRICKDNGIHMEASWTPIYNSAYVEGIHNLYEFDCGALSGWMYKVNGWYPNYGSSRYQLKEGDVVEWRYTCDLGNDIGGGYAVGG